MIIKNGRNLWNLERVSKTVKTWGIGWTAEEARAPSPTSRHDGQRPGAYGLLVGTGRR